MLGIRDRGIWISGPVDNFNTKNTLYYYMMFVIVQSTTCHWMMFPLVTLLVDRYGP